MEAAAEAAEAGAAEEAAEAAPALEALLSKRSRGCLEPFTPRAAAPSPAPQPV